MGIGHLLRPQHQRHRVKVALGRIRERPGPEHARRERLDLVEERRPLRTRHRQQDGNARRRIDELERNRRPSGPSCRSRPPVRRCRPPRAAAAAASRGNCTRHASVAAHRTASAPSARRHPRRRSDAPAPARTRPHRPAARPAASQLDRARAVPDPSARRPRLACGRCANYRPPQLAGSQHAYTIRIAVTVPSRPSAMSPAKAAVRRMEPLVERRRIPHPGPRAGVDHGRRIVQRRRHRLLAHSTGNPAAAIASTKPRCASLGAAT